MSRHFHQNQQNYRKHPVSNRTHLSTNRAQGLKTLTQEHRQNHTIWFEDEASPPVASTPQIIELFCKILTLLATGTPPPGVCVDGVDGGEGPAVFPVPVLLAAPEEVGFRFLVFWMSRN
jgi:hypothetical protein